MYKERSGSPEIEIRAKAAMESALQTGKMIEAGKISRELGMSDAEFRIAAIRQANVMDAIELLMALDGAERKEFLVLPETKSAAKEVVIRELGARRTDAVLQVIHFFELSSEELESVELQTAAKQGALETLKRGNHTGMIRIAEAFYLPEDFFSSPEVAEAAKAGKAFLLSRQSRPKELAANLVRAMKEKGCAIEE